MRKTRITPSLVIAVLALVVSLGGTSVAGFAVGRAHGKTNGNHLIKKHSLSGNRLKPGTVTGTQVAASTLGIVPHASVADAVPVPALVPLTAFGLWTVGTDRACGARKDVAGFVHLQGDIGLHQISANTPMTILPVGDRPAGTSYFGVGSGTDGATPGVVRVSPDGEVSLVAGDSPYVALDSIEFYAAG
jgi:hypothetical protein